MTVDPTTVLTTASALAVVLCVGTAVVASPQFVRPLAYVVLALMFLDLSPVELGASIRVYQPLALALLAAPRRPSVLANPQRPLMKWILLYTGLVVASIAWTISPTDTYTVAVGQVYLVFLFGMMLRLLNQGYITIEGSLRALMVGAALTCAAGMIQFVLAYADLEWQIDDAVGIPWHRPAGLMREPDWLALAAAVGLLIAIYSHQMPLRRVLLVLFGATVVICFVRAVLIALAAVLIVSLFSSRQASRRFAMIALPFLPLAAVALYLGFQVDPASLSRVNPGEVLASRGDQGAFATRTGAIALIRDLGPDAPWFGHGAGSLNLVTGLQANLDRYVGGGELNTGRGGTNLFFTNFWDLGLVGIAAITGFVLSWLRTARTAAQRYPVLSMLTVLLLVNFQANNGLRFGFVWVVLAITVHAASVVRTDARPAAADEAPWQQPRERTLAN